MPIITANNYELVKLDKPLVKGSGTDTDYDGAEDWDEVNVGLIYQLNPMSMGKKALLMDDMPTINEIIDYYDQAYVQSGLDRFTRDSLQYGSNPIEGVYRQSVAPIRSNPVDPDSDNDGVIDLYDSKELNGEVNSYKEGCDVEKAKETSFTVLKVFDLFEQGRARENVVLFSHPGGKIIGQNKLTAYENVCISSIIMKYNGNYDRFTEKCEYWLKIKTDNVFSYVRDDTEFV